MNTLTHAFFGLALSEALMLNPVLVIIGAILPDIDYLIGIQHRTITHSLLFLIPVIIFWRRDKRQGLSLLIGLSSHLILDSITTRGLPLLYPLNAYYSLELTSSTNTVTNIGFIIASIIIIINRKSIHEYLFSLKRGQALKGASLFIIGWFSTLLFFPISYCPMNYNKINELSIDGTMVRVKGHVCSEVKRITSNSGNLYQVFMLCNPNGNISVWKYYWVLENNLRQGDVIDLCGEFTTQYDEPEIYRVNQVIK